MDNHPFFTCVQYMLHLGRLVGLNMGGLILICTEFWGGISCYQCTWAIILSALQGGNTRNSKPQTPVNNEP